MALYHPPKIITNNAAPVLAADLAYEAHGKCGCETIILSDMEAGGVTTWDSQDPVDPGVVGCEDYSHVYRMVSLENAMFRTVVATNLSEASMLQLETGFSLKTGSEILADFTSIELTRGMVILYRDCEQS
tara:strand:- start:303 stop:692 length:390 start_codon:yes stop_codon:yes gene_type:complete